MSKARNQKQAHTENPVGELATLLEVALAHDEMPQALFNVIVDYFQEKIEVTGLEAPIPEISERQVMELVLAAERRRELFVEQQGEARLKSRAREVTHQDEAHEQACVEAEEAPPRDSMEAAIVVRTFLDEAPIPDFISYAVVDAIREASRRTGAPEPEVHPEQGFDLDALAYLFEVASTIDLRAPGFVVTPAQTLAAHLAAVMAHPETPTTLHNVMADELNSMASDVNFFTPDMIERMLEASGGRNRKEAQADG